MILFQRAGAIALVLMPSAALAQSKVANLPPHVGSAAIAIGDPNGPATTVSAGNPLPTTAMIVATSAAPVSGSASANITVAYTPQLGRPVRLITKLTAGSSYSAQVFTSPDGCSTLNQITAAGAPWATFPGVTGTINEDVEVPMIPGIAYCLTVTPSAGATVSYTVRQ